MHSHTLSIYYNEIIKSTQSRHISTCVLSASSMFFEAVPNRNLSPLSSLPFLPPLPSLSPVSPLFPVLSRPHLRPVSRKSFLRKKSSILAASATAPRAARTGAEYCWSPAAAMSTSVLQSCCQSTLEKGDEKRCQPQPLEQLCGVRPHVKHVPDGDRRHHCQRKCHLSTEQFACTRVRCRIRTSARTAAVSSSDFCCTAAAAESAAPCA